MVYVVNYFRYKFHNRFSPNKIVTLSKHTSLDGLSWRISAFLVEYLKLWVSQGQHGGKSKEKGSSSGI